MGVGRFMIDRMELRRGANADDSVPLRPVAQSSPAEDADTVDFFHASGLPLASVVLGLLDQSDDCIKVVGIDGSLQFMNCNGKKAMELDDFSAIAGKAWDELWPEESRPLVVAALARARDGDSSRFEAFCPTAKGDPRWWEVTVSPVRSSAGGIDAILATSRDNTAARRREEAASTVASEMKHRLRNAHAISASLLIASAPTGSVHADFARTVAGRLGRLADVQAKLLETAGGLSLANMCGDVAQVFEETGGELHCDGLPDVILDEDRARAVSLVLGELTTNSLKHGALGRGGDARVSATLDGVDLVIDWSERFNRDDGHAPSSSSGQGSILMDRIIRLYRGQIVSGPSSDGYHATIRLPVDAAA
jgi:PAS domain S-box-containing protein